MNKFLEGVVIGKTKIQKTLSKNSICSLGNLVEN